jgi:UDP:flavonoid glycosyltransferase YjiC (YdhE family)
MRWLFVTTPGLGHVQPLLGLALAARRRGHRVAWASGADGLAGPAAHEFETLACGPGFGESAARLRAEYPELVALPGRLHARQGFPTLFGRLIAQAMWPALRAAAEAWRPELIISEPAALAAPLLARCLGVPQLTHEFGLAIPPAITAGAAEVMAQLWQTAGFEVPPDAGLYARGVIEVAPPALRAAHGFEGLAPRVWPQRPSTQPSRPVSTLPPRLQAFLQRQAGRPVLTVSFGTLHRGSPGWQGLLRTLAGLDLAAVVLHGPLLPAPPDLPERLHVEPYVDYPLLFPACTAVISHGGAGSVLAALAHGLPQLLLPYGADQFRNADAAVACGAALSLEDRYEPADIGAAIERLLGDAGLRRQAEALQAQIQAMPDADATAAQIETAHLS